MSVNFLRNIQGSWTTDKSPARTIKEIVRDPWCAELLKSKMDKDGYITAVIAVELNDIIDLGIEGLNDLADEAILHESCGGTLSDLSFEVVGFIPSASESGSWCAGGIYLKVNAYVGDIVDDWEERIADETNKFADGVMTTSGDQ